MILCLTTVLKSLCIKVWDLQTSRAKKFRIKPRAFFQKDTKSLILFNILIHGTEKSLCIYINPEHVIKT